MNQPLVRLLSAIVLPPLLAGHHRARELSIHRANNTRLHPGGGQRSQAPGRPESPTQLDQGATHGRSARRRLDRGNALSFVRRLCVLVPPQSIYGVLVWGGAPARAYVHSPTRAHASNKLDSRVYAPCTMFYAPSNAENAYCLSSQRRLPENFSPSPERHFPAADTAVSAAATCESIMFCVLSPPLTIPSAHPTNTRSISQTLTMAMRQWRMIRTVMTQIMSRHAK